ncbi:MAG: DUF362 domain-containing protein [Desulfobacteraceae bacterium]|nr:DUF362 domain-containing protein [Desulfobacteraceae bacterium]
MTKVFVQKTAYDYDRIKPVVFNMLDTIATDRIGSGTKVLIKPNLLMPAHPDTAICTHPLVVKAACEYVLHRGGRPQISDSSAIGSFSKVLGTGGYAAVLKGLDVTAKAFSKTVRVNIGEPYGTVDIARDAMETDVIINLAKLKTHTQMMLTLGVKNLFGCVVGSQKPEWHLRAGADTAFFAQLLVRIHEAVGPTFTIVDGVLAMEGQGPGRRGTARPLGILVGGENTHAVDKVICILLGIEPTRLYTYAAAEQLNVFDGRVHINGDLSIVDDYEFSELGPLIYGPVLLHKHIRKHLIQRPVSLKALCNSCGDCWRHCPAKVITDQKKGVTFDYDGCIRCYCCIEVCPRGAIAAKQPFIGKLVRWLINKYEG